MSGISERLVIWMKSNMYRLRTIVPGVVSGTPETGSREQSIDVQSAIPDLVAGEAGPTDITPDTPMLNFASGGFFVLMPVATGDEVLGLVADRATGDWITTRQPGQVDEVNGARSHVLHDMLAVPFGITAPDGAPASWSGLTIGGPAGPAIELDDVGELTLTKQGVPVATITMAASGTVTIEVALGQKVNVGGPAAVEVPKWPQLEAAIDAMLAALVAAGAGVAFAGAGSAQAAWNAAKTAVPATKAMVE